MDIHKPKPWHGVREFLKEYLIIVVGVLTALGGEQAVEWLHQRTELTEARAALHDEVVEGATRIRIAAAEDRCYVGLLDRYEAWAKGGPKPPVANARAMFPVPDDAVWQSLKTGAVTRMPLREKLTYVRYYNAVTNNRSLYFPMRDHAVTMRSYLAWDTVTPAEARILLRDIERGRTQLGVMIRNAPLDLETARAAGGEALAPGPNTRATLAAECAAGGIPVEGP